VTISPALFLWSFLEFCMLELSQDVRFLSSLHSGWSIGGISVPGT
jgi:hypothetical protein